MELPLARQPVPYVEFDIPPTWFNLTIRMGGHFSDQSTLIFQGITGGRIEYVNMRRLDVKNLYSNAVTGRPDYSTVVVQQNIQAYDKFRVTATRLDPNDAIAVEFLPKLMSEPAYVGMINGVRAMEELDRTDQLPSYVIAEEPDSVVDFLRA